MTAARQTAAASLTAAAVDAGFATGWGLARVLPAGVARAAFTAGADLATMLAGPGVRQLRRNLGRVAGLAGGAELDALTRAAMRSYARYWQEAFQLPSMNHRAVLRAVDAKIL